MRLNICRFSVYLSLGLFSSLSSIASAQKGSQTVALIGARLIDGTGEPPLENSALVIQGETLSAVGISHKWKMCQSPEISVTCVLTHEMGHSEETTLKASPDTSGSKNSIQAIGSTVTYLERYTLLAAVGLAAAGMDNDGRAADEEQKPKTPEERVAECLSLIKEAPDLIALQRIFWGACQEAQKINDKDAEARYIRAKDQRKRVLRADR